MEYIHREQNIYDGNRLFSDTETPSFSFLTLDSLSAGQHKVLIGPKYPYTGETLAKIIFYVYLIVTPLILINLLIAMTNDVYRTVYSDKVCQRGDALAMQYWVRISLFVKMLPNGEIIPSYAPQSGGTLYCRAIFN